MVECQAEAVDTVKGHQSHTKYVTKKVRRVLCQAVGKQKKAYAIVSSVLQVSADDIRVQQETDPSLSQALRMDVDNNDETSSSQFHKQEGLHYRRWTPPLSG